MLFFVSLIFVVTAYNNCPPIDGFDLSSLSGEMNFTFDRPSLTNILDFAFCDAEFNSCGSQPSDECYNKFNCCGACQRWQDDDGSSQSACLGIFQKPVNQNGRISLYYKGGDPISDPPGPREFYVNLTCNPCASTPIPVSFIQPSVDGHTPGTPYTYTLIVGTDTVCADPCWSSSSCGPCTEESDCQWCFDFDRCTSRKLKNCNNWIRNSTFCPTCDGPTCSKCLASDHSCVWCSGSGCSTDGSTCEQGRIVDPKYCPS